MQSRFREEESEIICLTSTFRSIITLTEKTGQNQLHCTIVEKKGNKKTLRQQKRAFSSL